MKKYIILILIFCTSIIAGQEIALKAFLDFRNVNILLKEGTSRKDCAEKYLKISQEFPSISIGTTSLQLSTFLNKMAKEDLTFKEPKDINSLSEKEKIDYYIYKLRDVAEESIIVPANTDVLQYAQTKNSAAVALRKIGKPAIQPLIQLLDDYRPTRSISEGRNGNYVLRYCDAAEQILEVICAERFGVIKVSKTFNDGLVATGVYFSNVKPEYRMEIKTRIQKWWELNNSKDEAQWIKESLSKPDAMDWFRRNVAERLIELEGKKSIEFFKKWQQTEPNEPFIPILIKKASREFEKMQSKLFFILLPVGPEPCVRV